MTTVAKAVKAKLNRSKSSQSKACGNVWGAFGDREVADEVDILRTYCESPLLRCVFFILLVMRIIIIYFSLQFFCTQE